MTTGTRRLGTRELTDLVLDPEHDDAADEPVAFSRRMGA